MQTSRPRWDDLRVLLALVRRGSLKRAADELDVNISTVSRRLDALESAVGLHLFDRTSDGTLPTVAAEQLVPFAETMEQAAAGLTRTAEGFEVEPEGVVRITAPPGLADQMLSRRLPELLARCPRLQIELVSSVGYVDLTRREADIALRAIRPAAGDLIATKLARVPYAAIGSPKYLATLGRLGDPAAAAWITWGDDLVHLDDSAWIASNVPPEQVVLRTSSMTAQLEAARGGLGLMLAPRPFGELPELGFAPCAPTLRRSVEGLPPGNLWLVGHRALRDVPRVAAVWDWLRETFTLS